ncbi:MAG TPA: hypothetical protein DF383_03280, partial [Deltaproteobacteria bacterium]|nr:hypothetical protein [Deltaproteobacteria bacterium]
MTKIYGKPRGNRLTALTRSIIKDICEFQSGEMKKYELSHLERKHAQIERNHLIYELNRLPLNHSSKRFEPDTYIEKQRQAARRNSSLEVDLAERLRFAGPEEVEQVLDEAFGNCLGPKLLLVQEAGLPGGLRLLHLAAKTPGPSQEVRRWLLQTIAELQPKRHDPPNLSDSTTKASDGLQSWLSEMLYYRPALGQDSSLGRVIHAVDETVALNTFRDLKSIEAAGPRLFQEAAGTGQWKDLKTLLKLENKLPLHLAAEICCRLLEADSKSHIYSSPSDEVLAVDTYLQAQWKKIRKGFPDNEQTKKNVHALLRQRLFETAETL